MVVRKPFALSLAAFVVLTTASFAQTVKLSTATLAFSAQLIGTTSAAKNFTLTNTDNSTPLPIDGIFDSADYSETDTCGTSLAPLASCTISVTFAPIIPGVITGAITIQDEASNSPQIVSLTGTGVENNLPALELSATRIGFGNAFIAMGVGRDVTLRNTGQAPLLIAGILVTGDYFWDGACLATIAPGASCTLRITFFPTIAGGRNGVMEITSNAANSPHDVFLSGTGCFVPTPSRARFGVLICGG